MAFAGDGGVIMKNRPGCLKTSESIIGHIARERYKSKTPPDFSGGVSTISNRPGEPERKAILVQSVNERFTSFEFCYVLSSNFDRLAGLRVASGASRTLLLLDAYEADEA